MKDTIEIADINLDESPKVRVVVDENTVEQYAERYRTKKDMPPIVVFGEKNRNDWWLADGMHRILGAQEAGLAKIEAFIEEGDWTKAMAHALRANSAHGLPRTNADKRLCVREALKLWPKNSNASLSEACDVDDKTVAAVREEMEAEGEIRKSATRISSQGKEVSATRAPRKSEEEPTDSHGTVIPVEIRKHWARASEPKEMMEALRTLMRQLKSFKDDKDIMYAELNFTGILADLERVRKSIYCAVPYAVCTQCQGHPEAQSGGCRLCLGRGLISEFRWRSVPEEIRNLRTQPK